MSDFTIILTRQDQAPLTTGDVDRIINAAGDGLVGMPGNRTLTVGPPVSCTFSFTNTNQSAATIESALKIAGQAILMSEIVARVIPD
jgi:hypothetical protein